MRILLTGGTGFLGRRLCADLLGAGHAVTVLSRRPEGVARLCGPAVRPVASLDALDAAEAFDAVVNLAGTPVAERRWSAARRRELWESRVAFTRRLVAALGRLARPPAVLVSGSAVGYYGDRGDELLDETSGPGGGFLSELCAAWEAEAAAAERLGLRVCLARTGLVLDAGGGVLARMLTPFRLGLGARLGEGRQWMSWIALEDWCGLVVRLLGEGAARGAYNLVAPEPVTHRQFTEALACAVGRRARLAVPAAALRALLGPRAALLLDSQRVRPRRGEALGYAFRRPLLDEALNALLAGRD